MLKNKFKIIALLLVIILSITAPVVRAENEVSINTTSEDTDVEAISVDPATVNEDIEINEDEDIEGDEEIYTDEEDDTDTTSLEDEAYKEEDVYLVGDDITIDYIVDGNLFIIANSVTINSQIGGDAFIFANSLTIGEQGYIYSNLFTMASNIEINGVAYDVYSFSNSATISGYVYRDIKMISNSLNIFGMIGRNAFVTANNISFSESNDEENSSTTTQGMIDGDLNYTSGSEAEIPEGAVSGNVNYTPGVTVAKTTSIQDYIIKLGTFIATVIIIWLLCLWLAPKFLQNTNNLVTKKIWPVIGLGILTPIVLIVASIILLLLGITSTIGLLALILLFILFAISSSIFVIAVNNLVCKKLKMEKKLHIFGMLIVSSIVLWLVCLIPYLGGLISFIAVIIGLGLITTHLFLGNKINKEKEPVTEA